MPLVLFNINVALDFNVGYIFNTINEISFEF